jgi:3-methylcrotonyl-CoA carboxylase alpha subunit
MPTATHCMSIWPTHIGPSPARESYLLGERIIAAAEKTGAQAIHPGYGFLSENAEFAANCKDKGITFIGPSPEAIAAMGSKAAAKRIMGKAGVPLVPGYHEDDQSENVLRAAADDMGYPVLLKATAGGGGKGMRQVWAADEFSAALAAAKREAMAGFNDDQMLVEKYLTQPRHVEIQVFFDHHGNGVYLAERDCSVQRRHQKIIEEAPAPGMDIALRAAMGEAALAAGHAIDYRGAGTVEFLLDKDGSFYFMEMNTRLQVEHPVTEMITGQDLVQWQLLVAAGEKLPLAQQDIVISGHAFEARIYAEDPEQDFLPATGRLSYLRPPAESTHIRVDTGVVQGDEISVYYDPMIAKLVVWDKSRELALQRLATALADYRIGGTVTNLKFLHNLATCKPFMQAELDTGFIERHSEQIFYTREPDLKTDLPLVALALLLHKQQQADAQPSTDPHSPWHEHNAWRLNEPHLHQLTVHCHGQDHPVILQRAGDSYKIRTGGMDTLVRGELTGDTLLLDTEGHRTSATLARGNDGFILYLPNGACPFSEVPPDTGESDNAGSEGTCTAPMNGTIVALLVKAGTPVAADTPLIVMEAMKMEHTLRAPMAGTVESYHYQPGDLVDGGATLLDFTRGES